MPDSRADSPARAAAASRAWVREAVRCLERDVQRSADTHLFAVDLPALEEVAIYLKDESTHPTGSLKHRLATPLGIT